MAEDVPMTATEVRERLKESPEELERLADEALRVWLDTIPALTIKAGDTIKVSRVR